MEQHEMEKGQEQGASVVPADEVAHVIKKEEKKEWMLPASIVFAAIMISAAFMYASGPKGGALTSQPEKVAVTAPAVTDKDVVLGDPNAPMTIIEYGDFQCPGCVTFFSTGEILLKKQLIDTGKAKFIFRPFPIVDQVVGKGTESVDSSLALLCARAQGKFLEMHDGLYAAEIKDEEAAAAHSGAASPEGNGNLNRDLFVQIAKNSGADSKLFAACYDARTYEGELKDIVAKAHGVGVTGTPTLFVNGVLLNLDPRQYPTWQSVIDHIAQSSK